MQVSRKSMLPIEGKDWKCIPETGQRILKLKRSSLQLRRLMRLSGMPKSVKPTTMLSSVSYPLTMPTGNSLIRWNNALISTVMRRIRSLAGW